MSARRTSSTTSLSKYARAQASEEDLANRSLDFCNAFWGIADGGFDVLLTRIRGAVRTTEELRAFWKERAAIEDEYAKKLSKLAKQPLGRDEIGELRNSIDTLRLETDKQAAAHASLSQLMRKDLEQPIAELIARQAQFKKVSQTPIEKSFKAKQTQEAYVKKARQKYEDDCVRINSYTAQLTLVQGRDLEKVQLRLDKAKQTVQANEREFSHFARALADTTSRWEKEWKVFCDSCQDLEEERIESIKDNMWAYANSVSTVCVSDDESCEKLRVALEQVEPDKDVENFVRDYNTGSQIPDPAAFVDYNTLEAGQNPSGPTWRTASFARSSNRAVGLSVKQPSPADEEVIAPGNAGIGAGGGYLETGMNSRPGSAAANKTAPTTAHTAALTTALTTANGISSAGPSSPPRNGPPGPSPVSNNAPTSNHQGLSKQGLSPTGSQPSPSQLTNNSQAVPGPGKGSSPPKHGRPGAGGSLSGIIGEQDDPLAKHAAALRNASSGSVRKGSERSANAPNRRGTSDAAFQPAGGGVSSAVPVASGSSSGPASNGSASQAAVNNYQAHAQSVVGGPPAPTARTASPNPPTASFMIPPSNRSPSPIPVEEVVSTYQQHFPGERRSLSISRQNSVNRGRDAEQNASGSDSVPRAVSPARAGHVGIGAHGASPSPTPQPMSKSQAPGRATSPLGIAIDATGNVAQDSLAERMYGQQQQQEQQRRSSFYGGHGPTQGPPPHPYDGFPASGSQGTMYGQLPPQRPYPSQAPPAHVPPPQTQQAPAGSMTGHFYNPLAPQGQGTTSPLYNPYSAGGVQPVMPPPSQVPPGVSPGHPQYAGQQPHQSHPGFGYAEQPQQPARPPFVGYTQHAQQPSNGYQQTGRLGDYGAPQGYGQHHSSGYRVPSPVMAKRSPSPAAPLIPPTGQYTEDGQGVLFYVKALYDYQATIDEEFDFQAGDVIAVTATPEDGWWNGMLLDELRRKPGRSLFPSNFVSLF